MNKSWPSGNSYLRLVSSLEQNPKKRMIFCTQSELELQSVLAAVLQFKTHTTCGEVRTVVTKKPNSHVGTIEVFVDVSREMSS